MTNLPFLNYLNPHIYNAGFQNLNDFNNLNYLHKYNNYIQNKDYNYLSNEYNGQLYQNKNNLN